MELPLRITQPHTALTAHSHSPEKYINRFIGFLRKASVGFGRFLGAHVIEYLGFLDIEQPPVGTVRYHSGMLDLTPFTVWNKMSRICNTGTQASIPPYTHPVYRLE